jgi:hypothetical protein
MPYLNELNTTYDSIQQLQQRFPSFIPENHDVVRLVHDYRMYWKPPQRASILLLAESHKYTDVGLTQYEHDFAQLPGYPRRYVRFVYCLSYGESYRLNIPPGLNLSGRTWQFWSLFNEAVGGRYRVTNNRDTRDRCEQKIALLRRMQNEGVWLLDASIMGLCKVDGGSEEYDNIVSQSLYGYCLPIIRDIQPERIIVVGKMVYDRLLRLVDNEFVIRYVLDWIHQPNAILKNPAERRTLSDVL